MKIMAFTNVGMRSQLDSQEPLVEFRHCESGRLVVELPARGKTRALVVVSVKSMSNSVEGRDSMAQVVGELYARWSLGSVG